jgi:predicted anti-sigma-YlaC factor YlaD
MITLSCEEVRREISNYLDDDMSPSMRRLLETHLEQCRKCAVLLDSTHNVLVLLADEQRFELPAGFSIRVREMLAKELRGDERSREC